MMFGTKDLLLLFNFFLKTNFNEFNLMFDVEFALHLTICISYSHIHTHTHTHTHTHFVLSIFLWDEELRPPCN